MFVGNPTVNPFKKDKASGKYGSNAKGKKFDPYLIPTNVHPSEWIWETFSENGKAENNIIINTGGEEKAVVAFVNVRLNANEISWDVTIEDHAVKNGWVCMGIFSVDD